MRLVIISGFSGAGKSTALHALEDEGFYCMDNLTLPLLATMINTSAPHFKTIENIAVSVDVRGLEKDYENNFAKLLEQLKKQHIQVDIVFVTATKETLVRRYQEVKRPHPLGVKHNTLETAIDAEGRYLDTIRQYADIVINTSNLLHYDLINQIRVQVCKAEATMFLLLQSFGYKNGVPPDSNYVFDARCLPNPYWRTELRELTGKDPAVIEFLENNTECRKMCDQISEFLQLWMQKFVHQGKRNLTVSVGCTGGQHRSVYIVDKLFSLLQNLPAAAVSKSHRELN